SPAISGATTKKVTWTCLGGFMSSDGFANDYSDRMTDALAAQSLAIEGRVCQSGIFPQRVELEPLYEPLDPWLTFLRRDEPRMVPASLQPGLLAMKVLVPPVLGKLLPGAAIASLAGCPGRICFHVEVRNRGVEIFLLAEPDHVGFVC